MSNQVKAAEKEKKAVALSSIFASLFLTAGKLIVGVTTGSLGIISEAAHSALDLGAAIITYFAVSISDKPADREHHYGHGKVENFSALVEALLLLVTCIWIIQEAIGRLILPDYQLKITMWGFAIMLISIVVDFSRARALHKAAKKHNSQALKADALHFSSDILSSLVVIIGLIFAKFGFHNADPVAALIVAVLVIIASIRLGKQTIDGLLDRAPAGLRKRIESDVANFPGVLGLHKVRVRQVGPRVFGDLHVLVDGNTTVKEGHKLADKLEEKLAVYAADMVIHVEPNKEEEQFNTEIVWKEFKNTINDALKRVEEYFVGYHQFHIEAGQDQGLVGSIHLVLPKDLDLAKAYGIVRSIENEVKAKYPDNRLEIRLEPCDGLCGDCEFSCED